jgi:vacuolar protein sorting-associated protein 53
LIIHDANINTLVILKNGKLPSSSTSSAPSSIVGLGASPKLDSATTHNYRIPKGEEVTVCHVINTCEYCIDTVEALEDLIRDTINSTYAGKIDMMAAQDSFHDITAKSIRVLVSGLMNRNEAALRTLGATNWAMWDSVGEESPYVYSMHEEIEPFVTTVRALLPTSYFRSFCDRFASAFMEAYYDTLIRLKRISEPGTQQLLLDVYNLKTLFLKLPVLEEAVVLKAGQKKPAGGGSTIAPAMYTKLVQKQFGRIETLLKLVGTPLDLLIDNFRVQWVGGSALDLQVVLSLQGLKRPEQAKMLEQFGVDPVTALKGATYGVSSATIVSERVQNLQDQGSNVAAKVTSDLNQIGQKVNAFRNTFRG